MPIKDFPILSNASLEELENFEIINGYALHCPVLGENLSIAGFFEKKSIAFAEQTPSLPASENKH